MKSSSTTLLIYLFLLSANFLNAQINISAESHIGISVQNKNAIFRSQNIFCYGGGISYLADMKIIFSLEYRRAFFSEEMASIRNIRSHSLLPGIGYSTMLREKRMDILSSLSYSRVSFYSDESFTSNYFEFSKKSLWSQWGLKIGAAYYFKPWFGWSLSYNRFCARRYDHGNYQSFLTTGIVLHWAKKSNKIEQNN